MAIPDLEGGVNFGVGPDGTAYGIGGGSVDNIMITSVHGCADINVGGFGFLYRGF